MVRRQTRSIAKKTVKALLNWNHADFRNYLISKARRYKHVKVLIVDESYTTVTCNQCGTQRPKFATETFRCVNPDCQNIWL